MDSYRDLPVWYDDLTEDVAYPELMEYLNSLFRIWNVEPKSILDVACGTGTLSCMFAEHGYRVTGLDLSKEMLSVAKQKAAGLDCSVEFIHGKMQDFTLPEEVDALVCMLDSFNYLSGEDEGRNAIACFFNALKNQGICIFDIRPVWQLEQFDDQIFIDETDDVFCTWRTAYDPTTRICTYGMDIFVNNGDLWKRYQEEHLEYAFDLDWLVSELRKAGFGDVACYGDRSLFAPGEDEERIFIVAQKGEVYEG